MSALPGEGPDPFEQPLEEHRRVDLHAHSGIGSAVPVAAPLLVEFEIEPHRIAENHPVGP